MTDDSATGATETVLIVEDESALAELYGMWLSELYDVRLATDGETALRKLDESVDVILLDRRMPGLSGDEVLERVRNRAIECQIAFVTGVQPDVDIADLPIDEYLMKPVKKDGIEDAVEELLLRSRADIELQELLSLVSRKVSLEETLPQEDLEADEEYQRLTRRVSDALDRADLSVQNVSSKYHPDSCPECGYRWDIAIGGSVGFSSLGSDVYKCLNCGQTVRQRDPHDHKVASR